MVQPRNRQAAGVRKAWRAAILGGALILMGLAWGAETGKKIEISPREQAIVATAQDFAEAFNRGDAQAVAELWTENGSLIDEQGTAFKGRKAIAAEYAALFKQYPKATIEIHIDSIEYPTESVAIEDGVSSAVTEAGAPPEASRYTAVHVLKDGKWQMASVRERIAAAAQPPPRMEDLTWLIGTWEARNGGTNLRSTCQWFANKRFLQRAYTVDKDGVTTASGLQIIGLDPQAGTIRSWSFDSTGGHGTGFWTPTADGWRIDQAGTLADGTEISSHDFVIRASGENDLFGWRSMARQVGPAMLPDLPEVVLDRVKEKR